MTNFMVRVELHYPTSDDYNTLHAAMEAAGFSRIVRGLDGNYYQLPSGMYLAQSRWDSSVTILDRAAAAATTTGKRHGVLVTEGESAWRGLPTV